APASPALTRTAAISSMTWALATSGTSRREFRTRSRGWSSDGCEFLLVFDDGSFSEDNTFLISDWFKHVPPDVLAKNFGVPTSAFASTPDPAELYIFPLPVPGPLASDRIPGASPVPRSFSHRLMAQEAIRTKSGSVRIA